MQQSCCYTPRARSEYPDGHALDQRVLCDDRQSQGKDVTSMCKRELQEGSLFSHQMHCKAIHDFLLFPGDV